MTGIALALVVFSAFIHASWNFVLKKSGGGTGLIACASLTSLIIYAPIVAGATWYVGYHFQPLHLALMFCSGMIHTFYFLLLDRAYRSGGDLSIVYPLARSTGPLITIVVAVMLLGERPGPTIPPLLYDWGCNLFRVFVLVPFTNRRAPGSITAAWRERRAAVIAIALGSPLSYILVLTAMVFTPVSLVAPAREVSILFAALMGAHFLQEGDLARRVVAAIGMVLGISGLALG